MPKLRPRARIIRTIGDQLISGPAAALIELVKNAYDADASAVRITIDPTYTTTDGHLLGLILVEDDGHGMSAEVLVGTWFEPATTDKAQRRTSPTGRRMLGAKGVGRFATARLGRTLNLTAAQRRADNTVERSAIEVNWDDFERVTYLDEIDIPISSETMSEPARTGVTLEITRLRDNWSRSELEGLVRELRRLASPQWHPSSAFKLHLDLSRFAPPIHQFNGQDLVAGALAMHGDEVDPTEIRPLLSMDKVFHYRVMGSFDAAGDFRGTFINQRGDGTPTEFNVPPPPLLSDEETFGEAAVALNVYDREPEAIDQLISRLDIGGIGRMDARRILNENIGIGIFRDGFRVRPYGDAESDWLELERRRVQDPSLRIGHNQVWGTIEVLDERSSGLIERSSREGFEHNGAFRRLKSLVTNVLVHVEQTRQSFRQSAGLSRSRKSDASAVRQKATFRSVEREIERIPVQYRSRIETALRRDEAALKNAIFDMEEYQHALASRSALGLVVSQVLHEGRRFLSDISTRSRMLADGGPRLLEESSFGQRFRSTFGDSAKSISESSELLNKLFKALDPISGRRRGRPTDFDIQKVISRCVDLLSDSLASRGIALSVTSLVPHSSRGHGYEADLMAAALNIIDNAIHWLGTADEGCRRLSIQVSESKKYVTIRIANNGQRIAPAYEDNLFNPGFSLKSEGNGIGLAIAREAMRASKGDVSYDETADETTFVINVMKSKDEDK